MKEMTSSNSPTDHEALVQALEDLQSAEMTYRMTYDLDGYYHQNTLEARGKLRNAGYRARALLAALAALASSTPAQTEPHGVAPEPGDLANRGAIAQTFLDEDYEKCDSGQLADIMLANWDVRWKVDAPQQAAVPAVREALNDPDVAILVDRLRIEAFPSTGVEKLNDERREAAYIIECLCGEIDRLRAALASATEQREPHGVTPTFIPENQHGVKPGYYTRPDIVVLLRKHHTNPNSVHFIADMME